MADAKRQNAGGKYPVATPNIGPSGMVSHENALSAVIGARIRLETKLAAHPTLEGTLFTACPITNLVAISISSTPPTHHVLPISTINNFTLLSTASSPGPPSFTSASPPIAPVDPVALAKRADAAVARLKEAAARKNKSVTKEAQDLFDALIRTLPTRWDGTNIVVNDAVVITAPYRVEDCRLGAGQQAGMLARVKKVLENERRKLAERLNKVVPAVPAMPAVLAGGQRKGG